MTIKWKGKVERGKRTNGKTMEDRLNTILIVNTLISRDHFLSLPLSLCLANEFSLTLIQDW